VETYVHQNIKNCGFNVKNLESLEDIEKLNLSDLAKCDFENSSSAKKILPLSRTFAPDWLQNDRVQISHCFGSVNFLYAYARDHGMLDDIYLY